MDLEQYMDYIPVDYDLNSQEINPFTDFSDYAFWTFDKVIYYNEDADKWLIQPEYHRILVDGKLTPEESGCPDFNWDELYRMLTLEVDRRNALRDKTKKVMDGLATFFAEVVDPLVTDKAMELFDLLAYFKEKDETLGEIADDVEKKEQLEEKRKLLKEQFGNLNFAKK